MSVLPVLLVSMTRRIDLEVLAASVELLGVVEDGTLLLGAAPLEGPLLAAAAAPGARAVPLLVLEGRLAS